MNFFLFSFVCSCFTSVMPVLPLCATCHTFVCYLSYRCVLPVLPLCVTILTYVCYLCVTCLNCVCYLFLSLIVTGGYLAFQATHPALCENKASAGYKCTPLTSLSQPCMPVANIGPTRILPFLYLGSHRDAMSQETIQVGYLPYRGHL